jgi:hypothetical protein
MSNKLRSISSKRTSPHTRWNQTGRSAKQWAIGPETSEAADEALIAPFIEGRERWVDGNVTGGGREEVLEGFDDEGGVAVEVATDEEDGDVCLW